MDDWKGSTLLIVKQLTEKKEGNTSMKKHICAITSVLVTTLCLMSGACYADEAPVGASEDLCIEGDWEELICQEEEFPEDADCSEITSADEVLPDDLVMEEDDLVMEEDNKVMEEDDLETDEILLDDVETGTENPEQGTEDSWLVFEENADEELVDISSEITVNAEEITLYYLNGYYPDYISSIPDDIPTSFQIEVSGTDKVPSFVRSGSGINVDEKGLITLSNDANIAHETPGRVKVKIDGELVASIVVNQISYESYYAKQVVNADMERLGIMNLGSNFEKVKAICEYISTTYNYSGRSASMTGEVITGGADCWGNSDLVAYMCGQCGIPASIRNANFEPGAGAGHRNNIVNIDGEYYVVDCGYTGNAPRHYVFCKMNWDFEYFLNDDGTAELVSYLAFDSDVVTIPAQIGGYKVSSIRTGMLQEHPYSIFLVEEGSEYFSSRNGSLCSADGKTLIACPRNMEGHYRIPDGVETVGKYAFTYCSDITEITMPDSLTTIEDSAFRWCESLSRVNWSNSLRSIGEGGFEACRNLKEIIFPESLRTIGAYSFCASMQPEFVVIPSGVKCIGTGAFLNVPFMVVRARAPELGDGAIRQCRLFCHPGSIVDTTCNGTHFDIGLLDDNNKLILKKDFFIVNQSDRRYSGSEQTTTVANTEDYKWLRASGWIWSEEQDRFVYEMVSDNYDVTYRDNVDVGTATVQISGKNLCTGTVSYTFRIIPNEVVSSHIILLNASSIPLRIGQSTDKVKVSGLQNGDSIRSWSSDNEQVVTVSQDGVIRALNKTGTATVTVRTYYGCSASIKVKVQKKKVTAKKISVVKSITLKKGETYALNVLVTPITTTDKIKYKSAARDIAAVSGTGLITAKAAGRTFITVKCGKKKARINIKVN